MFVFSITTHCFPVLLVGQSQSGPLLLNLQTKHNPALSGQIHIPFLELEDRIKEIHVSPRVKRFFWQGKLLPAFWTVASVVSLFVNLVLIIVLISLGKQLFEIKKLVQDQLIGGLYYRYKDAFIPMVGLQWNDLVATFTYDATTSSLKNYNNGRGAFEFSLIKEGLFDTYNGDKRQSMCPSLRNKAY